MFSPVGLALRAGLLLFVSLLLVPASALAGTRDRAEPAFAGPQDVKPRSEPGVEVPELRTRTSRTFRAPNGELVARVWSSAVNFRDGERRWQKIDNRLEREGSGFTNRAGELDVKLPASLDAGPVRAQSDEGAVAFRLAGAGDARAQVDGATATYENALPNVDVAYEGTGEQLKETLTLSKGAQSRYAFDLDTSSELELEREEGGAFTVRDRDGRVRFTLAAPFVYDADGTLGPEGSVEVSLSGGRLVLQIDEEWLRKAFAKGDVVLDPVVSLPQAMQDTAIESSPGWDTVDQSADQYLRVGGDNTYDTRALLKFDVDSVVPLGADVRSASMYLYSAFDITGASKTISAYEAQTPWTNQATWQTRDGSIPWVTGGGDPTGPAESTVAFTSPYQSASFGLTKLVRKWTTGGENRGVVVRADDNATTAENYYGFISSEHADWRFRPSIDVAYRIRVGARGDHEYLDQSLTDRESLSVDLGSGNLLLSANDLTIAGTGLDLQVQRTYQSRQSEMPTDIGVKSSFSFQQWLDRPDDDGSIVVNDAGGANYRLVPQPNAATTFRGEGLQATLTRNGDGTYDLLYDGSDRKLRFEPYPATGPSELQWEEDRNGNRLTYAYQQGPAGQPSQTTITDTQGRQTVVTYSQWGPVTKVRDFTGRETTYQVNSDGAITKATAPTGAETTYGYSTNGRSNLTSIDTPGGGRTEIGYDGQDRVTSLTRVTNPQTGAGDTWTVSYATTLSALCTVPEAAGTKVQTTVTDPRGKQTRYCVDANQRVIRSQDPRGNVRNKGFNPRGYVEKITSPGATSGGAGGGVDTEYAYNSDDAITSITRGGAGSSTLADTFAYSTSRTYQPKSTTNPQGNSRTFGYDDNGNTRSTRQGLPDPVTGEADGEEVKMTYDAKGNVTTSTDPNGNVTSYAYDAAGNPTSITPPAPLGATTITTDDLSRIKTVTDGKGQVTTYTYDQLDRVTKVEVGSVSTTFVFDGAGNTVTRGDAPAAGLFGLTVYQYDRKNRLTKTTQPDYHATEYAYDQADNLTSLKDFGGTTTYAYDDANLLASVQEPGGGSPTVFEHNPQGNRSKMTLPNGIEVDTPYDGAGRLQSITAKKGSTLLQSRTFDYQDGSDETDLIQKVTDGTTATTTTYGYDELERLTSASGVGGSQASNYTYAYDDAGNRLQEIRRDPGQAAATTIDWSYNQANQPATRDGQPAGYGFDANGNELGNGAGRTQAYNVKDQTTSVAQGGTSTPLVHLGTSQEDLGSVGGVRRVQDALGLAYKTASSGSWSHYTRTPQGEYIGERKASRSYFLTDERGSIVASTNAAGVKTADYRYDPYGRPLGTPHDTLGYASGEQGPAGLVHYGARYYDPQTGRWTQTDPIDRAGDLNGGTYLYGDADPVNNTDPTGEAPPAVLVAYGVGAVIRGGVALSRARSAASAAKVAANRAGYRAGMKAAEKGKFYGQAARYPAGRRYIIGRAAQTYQRYEQFSRGTY